MTDLTMLRTIWPIWRCCEPVRQDWQGL